MRPNGGTDRQGVDARLGDALADLGGETDVWPVLADSPAVNLIPGCYRPPTSADRAPVRPGCESGAYEHDPVSISVGPSRYTNIAGPTSFHFTGPPGASYSCVIQGVTDITSCDSPFTREGSLDDGTYTFRVGGSLAGPIGSAERTFTVDTQRPSAPTIETPKEGETVRRVLLSGSAEPFATVEVREIGAEGVREAVADDAGYWRLDLGIVPPGQHSYQATTVDRARNQSETAASVTVRVSASEPPVAVITAPTDTVFQNRTPKFEFTGGHTYQCRLGDAQFAPCVSGVTYGPLDDGNYRFEVRAIAEDGLPQEGATPLFFTVDNAAPVPPTIDEPMDGAVIARRSVMLRGQTEDFTDVEVYEGTTLLGRAEIENEGTGDWKFPVDGLAPWATTSSALGPSTTPRTSRTIRLRSGCTSPRSPSRRRSPRSCPAPCREIAFAASKPDELMFECRHEIQGGGEPEIITGCTSPFERRELIEGTHTFSVVAVDADGPGDESLGDSWTFTVDQTGPETTIDSGPSGATQETSAEFTFGSGDPEATFHCRYVPPDGQVQEDGCESPFMLSELADGTHRLEVIALDALGNRDATPAVRTWTVDTRAPQPAVDAAAAGAAATLSFAAEPGVTYSCALEGPSGDNGASAPARRRRRTPICRLATTASRCARSTPPATMPTPRRRRSRSPPRRSSPSRNRRPLRSRWRSRPLAPPTPTPQAGETVVVRPVSGKILVRGPGTTEFVELDASRASRSAPRSTPARAGSSLTAEPDRGQARRTRDVLRRHLHGHPGRGGIIDLTLTEELAPCRRRRRAAAQPRSPRRASCGATARASSAPRAVQRGDRPRHEVARRRTPAPARSPASPRASSPCATTCARRRCWSRKGKSLHGARR